MSTKELPAFAHSHPNVALERFGARITGCSDEFFAPAIRAISDAAPVFIPDKYDDNGKWMDGWESRRRRVRPPDHDWMALELGAPALLLGFNISTKHFTGNYPPQAMIEGSLQSGDDADWQPLVELTDLGPDADHWLSCLDPGPWLNLRVRIYPDGGIARLRAHGQFAGCLEAGQHADLALIMHGARAIGCSDAHFGAPENMLAPGDGINMGDGWETARRRGEGHDWAVIALGCPGVPDKIIVDTKHFKGNYPASCELLGADLSGLDDAEILAEAASWPALAESVELGPNAEFVVTPEKRRISHVRLNIHPDGGVSRLRIFGEAQP